MKISIAFYIDSMQKGGANRVVANLVNYFVASSYDVFLINDVICKDESMEYQIDERVNRIIINCHRENRFISNVNRIKRIRSVLKKEKIDVVISFLGPPNIRLLIAGMGLKCKKIISVRNDPNVEYGSSATTRYVVGKLFSFADGCVFQTREAMTYFPKTFQKKSRIILNPVNEVFFRVRRCKVTRNIISIGRLDEQKNHKLLIDSFNKIKDEIPHDSLIIYGEGILRKELEQYISEYKLEERVLLPGQVSNVADVLSKASVFVLPSKYEGLPNVLMEAMTVGVPVISTDCPCGGPRTLISNKLQGQLVPSNNIDSMAKAILDLIKDDERRCIMSTFERERAKSFKVDIICTEWENFFYFVMNGALSEDIK